MEFVKIIEEFAKVTNIDRIDPDEDGCYRFEIDGMVVTLSEVAEAEELFMWAEVGALPPEGREALFHTLLTALFMGRATQGSVLSIDADSETVVLHRVDSLRALDFDGFKMKLEQFVNVLETWRKLLDDYRPVAHRQEEAKVEAADAAHQVSLGNFIRI